MGKKILKSKGIIDNMSIEQSNPSKIVAYVFLVIFTIILTVAIIYLFCQDDVAGQQSSIDGQFYKVRNDPVNGLNISSHFQNINNVSVSPLQVSKPTAADFLASISSKIDKLASYMIKHHLPDREISSRFYNRWRKCKLRETSSVEKSAAYTVNKGEEMRLCIRKNGSLEDQNTAMFVVLHEIGHVMSLSYGHNAEFRENFSFIVHLASELGLYKPQNFENNPVDYCGTQINTTPCSHGTCSFKGNTSDLVEWFMNLF